MIADITQSKSGHNNWTNLSSCFMALSTQQVIDIQESFADIFGGWNMAIRWCPTLDDDLFTTQPWMNIQDGRFSRHPWVGGNQNNEGTLWGYKEGGVPTEDIFRQRMNDYILSEAIYYPLLRTTPNLTSIAMAFYLDNKPADQSLTDTFSDFFGDIRFVCAVNNAMKSASSHTGQAWQYHMNSRCDPLSHTASYGVYHGSEIPYTFNYNGDQCVGSRPYTNYRTCNAYWCNLTQAQSATQQQVMTLWATFATNRTFPTAMWPKFLNTSAAVAQGVSQFQTMNLESPLRISNDSGWFRKQACEFWQPYLFANSTATFINTFVTSRR